MRSWFITGVSSGLGRALAEAVLERGDRVSGTVRTCDAAASFAALAPSRACPVRLDVSDHDAAARAVVDAGTIDFLVNNAGYSFEGVVEASSLADLTAQLDLHVVAPVALIRAALPSMRARRSGHIVNIGSLAAHRPGGGVAAYAAAKAAIETLSVALADEVAPFGIRVTIVVPGAFRTKLGTARGSAASDIDAYAAADSARRARLAALSGRQRGDPAKAAAAILAALDAASPPLRLALGPDAVEGFRRHAAALAEDAAAWEAIATTTDLVGYR